MDSDIPVENLARYLNVENGYIILRNENYVRHLQQGGDVDIIVPDITVAYESLCKEIGVPSYVFKRLYVWSCFYSWGHIDLIPCLNWRGVLILDYNTIRKNAVVMPNRTLVASKVHQAFIVWVWNILSAGVFKDKYRGLVQDAVSSGREDMKRMLVSVFGLTNARYLLDCVTAKTPDRCVARVKKLRISAFLRALVKYPVKTLYGFVKHFYCEVSIRLFSTRNSKQQ